MAELVITVRGTPTPQGSKFAVKRGDKAVVIDDNKTALTTWRQAVADAWRDHHGHTCLVGPVEADITFYLPRPAGHYGRDGQRRPNARPWPWVKPDLDKLARSTLDGLSKDVRAISDDSRVITLTVRKRYADLGVQPGAVIKITEVAL